MPERVKCSLHPRIMRKRAISFENGKNHSDEVCSVCAQNSKKREEINTCRYLFICGIFFVRDTESLGAMIRMKAKYGVKAATNFFLWLCLAGIVSPNASRVVAS